MDIAIPEPLRRQHEQADMGYCLLPAPAKINLFLHVVGQRTNGYHLLQTVFQFVDLYDYLSFRYRDDGQIRVHLPQYPNIKNQDNLIYRAAKMLQGTSRHGVDIWCHKQIPIGGGLGGGSSNAATTLIALNRLWGLGLTRQQLQSIGLELGADVPIFIYGQPAFAEGLGEQLQAVPATPGSLVLWMPNVFVATAQVFKDKGLTRDTKQVRIFDFVDWHESLQRNLTTFDIRDSLIGSNGQIRLFGRNDLQPVAIRQHGQLDMLMQHLQSYGVHANISGSGSSVFALFATTPLANRHLEQFRDRILFDAKIRDNLDVQSTICNLLDAHPLYSWLS